MIRWSSPRLKPGGASDVPWNLITLGVALLAIGVPVGATATPKPWRIVAYVFILGGAVCVAVALSLGLRRRSRVEQEGQDEGPPMPEPGPRLELGRAYLPRQPQYGSVEGFDVNRPGRLIQVPVTMPRERGRPPPSTPNSTSCLTTGTVRSLLGNPRAASG